MPPPSFDLAEACKWIRTSQTVVEATDPPAGGPPVHLALALDGNLKQQFKVVVEAIATHTDRRLKLWVLCRDHGPEDYRRLAALFPGSDFVWLPCDGVDYGPIAGMLKHITVATMDRLLLPDLLDEVERVVYIDIDTLPLADVGTLYDWDLRGRPLAARSSVARDVLSGFSNLRRSAHRLRHDPEASWDLIRRVYHRHEFDFTSFNAGILVLDLARMRADDFCREFIPFVERYGMNDQEILNCYAGPDRAVLPPRWNAFPTQEVVDDPGIIHWAGWLKPWRPEYVHLRERWVSFAERMRAREAALLDG